MVELVLDNNFLTFKNQWFSAVSKDEKEISEYHCYLSSGLCQGFFAFFLSKYLS